LQVTIVLLKVSYKNFRKYTFSGSTCEEPLKTGNTKYKNLKPSAIQYQPFYKGSPTPFTPINQLLEKHLHTYLLV
jgi:hypothetical protein